VSKKVVFITGVTGFIGCHLAVLLIANNYKIIATKRSNSNLKNCSEFQDKIEWINIEEENWQEEIIALKPSIIVHSAWIGVTAQERDDWELQSKNLSFLEEVLFIAKHANAEKFIALGSQAEYGLVNTVVKENHVLKPTSAYGAVKIICSQLIKSFCVANKMQWYWLRIFSVFGEKEGPGWLIPNVIRAIDSKEKAKMEFSPGDQQYAYLYIKDCVEALKKVISHPEDASGFYNLSSAEVRSLKYIITLIRDKMDKTFYLEFGALSYRKDQSMLIAGDMTSYNSTFGNLRQATLSDSLDNTINYYTSKVLNESI
jgi:nucleoside-diphosphate-sugar epimerase